VVTVRPVPDAGAGLAWRRTATARSRHWFACAWLHAAISAVLCGAAQGGGVPRWSRTMATASRWVSPEPAEIA
jgi:hypothetical protein